MTFLLFSLHPSEQSQFAAFSKHATRRSKERGCSPGPQQPDSWKSFSTAHHARKSHLNLKALRSSSSLPLVLFHIISQPKLSRIHREKSCCFDPSRKWNICGAEVTSFTAVDRHLCEAYSPEQNCSRTTQSVFYFTIQIWSIYQQVKLKILTKNLF